jgi:hypothetical protein
MGLFSRASAFGRVSGALVGKVTQPPRWRKRRVPGCHEFEPILEAVVTLTGVSGWPAPMLVWLNVTRLDVGVCTIWGLGVEVLAREAMRRFLHRSKDLELAKLRELRSKPPRGAALAALECFGPPKEPAPCPNCELLTTTVNGMRGARRNVRPPHRRPTRLHPPGKATFATAV